MTLKDRLGGDYTPLEHAGYALAMQAGTLLLFGWLHFDAALTAGAALGIGFFAGREHAQAEKRLGVSIWRAFDMRLWDRGSVMDLACPGIACAAVTVLALIGKAFF